MYTRRLHAADLTGKYWNATTAARVLAAWRASGTSLSKFAGRHGVKPQRLNWWRKRLNDTDDDPTEGTVASLSFIPAVVSGSGRVALRLPGGVELEGDAAAIPAEWVAALARALGRT